MLHSRASKEKGEFDYKVIQDQFESLCEATANLLEREWPKAYQHVDSARVVFFHSLRIAINTYYTIFFVIADEDYYARKKVFALSLAPLNNWLYRELSGQTHLNVAGITM